MPQRLCPPQERLGSGFTVWGMKRQGCRLGSGQRQACIFFKAGVQWSGGLLSGIKNASLTSSIGWGFQFCRRTQRYCYLYSWRRDQDPAPKLYHCFLTAPLTSLHPLPFLINNCLNLSFGTQGRSWLDEAYFLQIRNGGHGKSFVPTSPTLICVYVYVCACVRVCVCIYIYMSLCKTHFHYKLL